MNARKRMGLHLVGVENLLHVREVNKGPDELIIVLLKSWSWTLTSDML